MISATTLAKYFLLLSLESNSKGLQNKKLQKLLYYAQVWYYTFHGRKLFKENLEAWVHGPVVPVVYGIYKAHSWNYIPPDETFTHSFDKATKDLLNEIWSVYGKYDADYLEALTHSELPWQQARAGLADGTHSNNTIDLELAKSYYGKRLKEASKTERNNTRTQKARAAH